MGLVEDWRQVEAGLPDDWGDARLSLTVPDEHRPRAGALLAPLTPGRAGSSFRFFVVRHGAGPRPEALRRALRRLDDAGVPGELELLASGEPAIAPPTERPTFAASWAAELDALPSDWSDAYVEVELLSTDHLERTALLMSPLNPSRYGGRPGFRFRAARVAGYGASTQLVRRCFERLDESGIRGRVRVVRALSDTRHVQTQGPVWYVGGKAV